MQIKHTNIVGIDLGTSNIVVAWIDETGTPRTISINGNNCTRSITYLSNTLDEIITGEEADNMRLLEPEQVFTYVKRHVGTDKVFCTLNNTEITPMFIQAQQLKFIYEEVQKFLGTESERLQAVITVPAGANEAFRQSVVKSAQIAGFKVLEIINEPTAAAIDNGFQDNQGDRLVVVADFGGGTCDLSIGSMQGGKLNILGSNGNNQLGGKDVNDLLIQKVVVEFQSQHGIPLSAESHPHEFYELEKEVERQKIMLSAKSKTRIVSRVDGKVVDLTITREEFSQMLAPLIAQVEALMTSALEQADVDAIDIEHVIYVGGSTRLKPFREWAEGYFGKEKIFESKVSPDLTVAQGAAIRAIQVASESEGQVVTENFQAIPIPEVSYEDVTSNPLGIAIVSPHNKKDVICSVVLDRNTAIPAKGSNMFNSVNKSQTLFHLQVLQGEEGAFLKDCLVVGDTRVTLPARPPQADSLEITMSYDRSGMVTVTLFDTVSQYTEDITVDFSKPKAKAS